MSWSSRWCQMFIVRFIYVKHLLRVLHHVCIIKCFNTLRSGDAYIYTYIYIYIYIYYVSVSSIVIAPANLQCQALIWTNDDLQSIGPAVRVKLGSKHYCDVIMGAMASQITSLAIVYSTFYSGADQRKHQSSASLAFVRGIHRWSGNSPHK